MVLCRSVKSLGCYCCQIQQKDPFFKKVVDSQKGYAKKVMAYLLLNSPDYGMAYKHHFGDPAKAI